MAGSVTLLFWQTHQSVIYRTGAGERRVVTLADGPQITLDTRNIAAVRYTAGSRELELDPGQAPFDVADDVERLFTIAARGHKEVATGTAFNADSRERALPVTLIKSHVVVLPAVVARTNRYSKCPIVIGNASTANLRISGVFHEGDVDGFVNTLACYLPIRASAGPGGSIVLTSARAIKHRAERTRTIGGCA